MINIVNGSILEGGGQVIRNAMVYSALSGIPIQFIKVRHNRNNPGLKRQHLAGVEEVARLTNGELDGAEISSQTFNFTPGDSRLIDVTDFRYKFKFYPTDIFSDDCASGSRVALDTGGSVTLISQCILPILLFSPSQLITYEIEGGTHVPLSPTPEYIRYVLSHYFNALFCGDNEKSKKLFLNQPLFESTSLNSLDSDDENETRDSEDSLNDELDLNTLAQGLKPINSSYEEADEVDHDSWKEGFEPTDIYSVACDAPVPVNGDYPWFDLSILRVGFTAGGGICHLRVKPLARDAFLPAFDLSERRGHIKKVRMLVSYSRKISLEFINTFIDGVQNVWRNSDYAKHDGHIRIPKVSTLLCKMDESVCSGGGGYAIIIAECSKGYRFAVSHAFERSEKPLVAGGFLARDLIQVLNTCAPVDNHLLDQLIIFAAVAQGTSKILVPKVRDLHFETALHWARELLGIKVTFQNVEPLIEGEPSNLDLLTIEGAGIQADFDAKNF